MNALQIGRVYPVFIRVRASLVVGINPTDRAKEMLGGMSVKTVMAQLVLPAHDF